MTTEAPPIDVQPYHWLVVRDVLRKHAPNYSVWAFGSRAKWNAKTFSDLDLAILTERPMTLAESAELSEAFSESDLPFKVDIVDWSAISEEFKKVIARDKVVVQASQEENREMTVLPLDACLDALIDYRGKTPRKVDSGIPLITAKVVKGGRIAQPDEFISEADYETWMTRGYPELGDVVLTTEAPLGEVAQIKFLPVALAQRVITLRGKPGVLDSSYLLYLLQSDEMQTKLLGRSTGTTVVGIKQSELRKIELALPPVSEQRAIAHILGTLDDKIELNRHRNQTLEAMARALFKDWFVDFGPVRAKMQLPSPTGRGVGGEGSNPQPRRKLPLPDTIRQHAAQLRRNATDAENLLWRLLRNQQLASAKFRRQHAVPPYILDFYCHELKLAVELDGGQHNEPTGRAHDARRTEYLHARGIEVLRFWNHDVLRETEDVLEAIYQAIEARRDIAPSPPPPLPGGEGSTAPVGVEGERSATGAGSTARVVAKAVSTTTDQAIADALKPFSPREKGWDEGAYLPPDLWNLFPDRLDDEGKPEGWESKRISEFLTLAYGKSLPAENRTDGGVPVYGSGGITGFHNKSLVNGPTVIVGRKGTVGSLYWEDRPCFPIDTVFHVQPNVPLSFCYYLLESLPLRSMNTDAAVPGLNRENVYRLEVAAPPAMLISCFDETASRLRESIAAISRDSETLAQLRDTLLPKLISGELRIADAEAFMERVA